MKEKTTYYDGTKLLSMQDLNGNKPEIYICTSNRSAGKTTWFNRYFLKRFKENNEKFLLLYRYKYEIDDCVDKFFKDIHGLFFPTDDFRAVNKNQIYKELIFNNKSCGYAISLNSADMIKKYSHLFSDVTRILFDEFQSENNSYLPDEIKKFISVHTSVSRGHGCQSRYVPVFMISNNVNILNPYYCELSISERLQADTKFLKGNGWVLEQGFNESAMLAQQNSIFMKAFSSNTYALYSSTRSYLYDDTAFIEKLTGASRYICTLRYDGNDYSIREYSNEGFLYCDNSVDKSYKIRVAVNADDMIPDYVMQSPSDSMVAVLRKFFNCGRFRFKNLQCKKAVINMLKY